MKTAIIIIGTVLAAIAGTVWLVFRLMKKEIEAAEDSLDCKDFENE